MPDEPYAPGEAPTAEQIAAGERAMAEARAAGYEAPTPEQAERARRARIETERRRRIVAPPEPVVKPPVVEDRVVPPPPPKAPEIPDIKIPKEAKKVEVTAEGRPAVYQLGKERYYASASTMHKMGFRTHSEYIAAQRMGVSHGIHAGTLVPRGGVVIEYKGEKFRVSPADLEKKGEEAVSQSVLTQLRKKKYTIPVIKIDERGHSHEVFITATQADKLGKLTGLKQFRARIKLGLIPKGSEFVAGVEDEPWSFYTPKDWETVMATTKKIVTFEKTHTQLPIPDKQGNPVYLKTTDLNRIKTDSPALHGTLMAQGYSAYQAEVSRINAEATRLQKLSVELPDGSRINKTDLINLKHDDPAMHAIMVKDGYGAYEKAIDKRNERMAVIDSLLIPYTSKESVDIAGFMRKQPGTNEEKEQMLRDIGFTDKHIEDTKEFNLEYLGIGSPEFVTTKKFVRDYFDKRGWEFALPREDMKKIEQYYSRASEATQAYKNEFAPPMPLRAFQQNYFADEGWLYDKPFGHLSDKERLLYDKRMREARSAYVDKYGANEVVGQGFGSVADMVVPGVLLAKDWKTMTPKERGVILAIDVAFIALVFNRPLTAGLRGVIRAAFIDNMPASMDALRVAIRSRNATTIRTAALRVAQTGVTGNSAVIPATRALANQMQKRALQVVENSEYLAAMGGRVSDSQIDDYVRMAIKSADFRLKHPYASGGVNWKEVMARELEHARVARGLAKTAVVPISRSESRALGLSKLEEDRIFSKVGENRSAFLKEARKLQADKARVNQDFDKIVKEMDKDFRIGKPAPSERFTTDFYRELGKSLKSKYPNLDPSVIDDIIAKATRPGVKLASVMIVIQAKIYEAMINQAAARELALIEKGMTISRAIVKLSNEKLLASWIVADPARASRLIAQASPATRAIVRTSLGAGTRALTKALTKALAKAQTKAMAKAQAKTMAKAMTKAMAKAETKAVAKVEAKALTKAVTRVEVKPIAKIVPKPLLKPVAKFKIPAKPIPVKPVPVKPAPVKPVPTKPVPLKPPPPIIPLRRGASDKEKRKHIKKAKGAIAFNMGEVGAQPIRKRVWHVLIHPWRPVDYLTVVGKAPAGATVLVEGENSAYRTAQLLYGKAPSRRISMDIGFMDVVIAARGRKINLDFTPDPKGLTTGDITVGRPRAVPPITERPPRLTSRNALRITPKRPRLKR